MELKHQQFEDSKSEEIELRGSKCQRLYVHGNEEKKGLDKFKGEDEGQSIRDILFPFVVLP